MRRCTDVDRRSVYLNVDDRYFAQTVLFSVASAVLDAGLLAPNGRLGDRPGARNECVFAGWLPILSGFRISRRAGLHPVTHAGLEDLDAKPAAYQR
jgi:hypothetical protein